MDHRQPTPRPENKSPARRAHPEPTPGLPERPAPESGLSETPGPANPEARLLSDEALQSAQRQAAAVQLGQLRGNHYLQQRLAAALAPLQRQPHDAGLPAAGVVDPVAQELQAFRDHGPYPAAPAGQLITPTTGMGGFNAAYDPGTMALTIRVNVAMTFVDGMAIAGNTVTAADPSLSPAATRLNAALSRLTGPDRQAALDRIRQDWQWTGGGADPRIATWMTQYRSAVQNAWGSAGTGIVFQSGKPGWGALLARTNVVVNTTNVSAPAGSGPVAAGPQPTHCQARIFKTPDGNNDFGASVAPGRPNVGTDQRLALGSGQTTATNSLLTQSVGFAHDSHQLSDAAKARLRRWIISFQAPRGGAGTTLDLIGHANTVGGGTAAGDAYNQQLSLRRAQAVEQFIRTERVEGRRLENVTTRVHGVVGRGSAGATAGAEWRRVDLVAAGGQVQNVAVHEFGHMIGLFDEYASTPQRDASGNIVTDAQGRPRTRGLISGTGGDVGDLTGHNPLAQNMGLGGSVTENNDNIMSLGNTIRPQHYATFMEALRTVTSNTPAWRLKA